MLDFKEEGAGTGGYAKTMSAEFIAAEMALFAEQAKEVDIIITTALIPGKPAPKLITTDMVKSMKAGSVIVDLAAEQGGNCELTEVNQVVVKHEVTLIGYTNLPSRLANQASQLYATNLRHLLTDLCPEKNGELNVNMDDEVIRGATVIKEGSISWPPPPPKLSAAPATAQKPVPLVAVVEDKKTHAIMSFLPMLLAGLCLFGVGAVAPESFMTHFTVFVLACFVGYQVIWNVKPALHTPLMSVTNAISGIIVLGAIVQISAPDNLVVGLATLATLLASINIAGGFLVTRRMLDMFRK
jgi:NAD(P) transhydrogenase subunit alpha